MEGEAIGIKNPTSLLILYEEVQRGAIERKCQMQKSVKKETHLASADGFQNSFKMT